MSSPEHRKQIKVKADVAKTLFSIQNDDLEDILGKREEVEDLLLSDSIFNEIFPMSPPLETHLQSEPFWTLKVGGIERFTDHVLLHASILNTDICCTITLRDQWVRLDLPEGTTVNIVFTEWSGNLLVDQANNYLIVHPERLLSVTTLADAFVCRRKSLLSLLYAQAAEDCQTNSALIIGSIAHELFEARLKGKKLSMAFLDDLLNKELENIYLAGENVQNIRDKCSEFVFLIDPFIKKHLGDVVAQKCEENIWSLMFGIKGKIDATVRMKGRLMPLELKTARRTDSIVHRAQTLLYCLLLQDRYREDVNKGLLVFPRVDELVHLSLKRGEVIEILMTRNQLCLNLESKNLLPRISNQWMCQQCSQLSVCTTIEQNEDNHWLDSWDKAINEEESCIVKANLLREENSFTLISCDERGRCVFAESTEKLTGGDPVVVSNFKEKLFGLAVGFVESTNPLIVLLRTSLNLGKKYQVQKDELSTAFPLYRSNVLKVLINERLRRLILHKQSPKFSPDSMPSFDPSLDKFQNASIEHVLRAEDYALIVGMPGAGKTQTLSCLISILVAKGKKILVTSHTHNAVDNLLIRCMERGVPVRRLGQLDKIDARLHPHIHNCSQFISTEEISAYYEDIAVLGCTTMAISHAAFTKLRFDYVIVDEAAQINIPLTLGVLRMAEKWVLVGDPQQLPPLCKSNNDLLSKSMMQELMQTHPNAVTELRLQYRMNSEICDLANRLVYQGKLECGSEEVSKQEIKFPFDGTEAWIKHCCDNSVTFVDTAESTEEECVNGSFRNVKEAEYIQKLVDIFTSSGLAFSIAVLCPYREQLSCLSNLLKDFIVEVCTIDRFQGRDADIIIVSLTRTCYQSSTPTRTSILDDLYRINVAITRAKEKLIIFGDRKALQNSAVLKSLIDACQESIIQVCSLPKS